MNKRELKTQITLLKKRMQKIRKNNTNVKELYFQTCSIEGKITLEQAKELKKLILGQIKKVLLYDKK